MTYKLANLGVRLWAVLYTIHCIFALALIVRALTNNPVNQAVLISGLVFMGLGFWPARKLRYYYQLRRKIAETWEKKFDDVEFLLTQAGMLDYRDGLLSLLWKGSRATSWISSLTVARATDLYRTSHPLNPMWFYDHMIEAWGEGNLEQSSRGVFRIGRRVFELAKKNYPLERFDLSTE